MNLYNVHYTYSSRDLNRTKFNVTDEVLAATIEEAIKFSTQYLRRGSYSTPIAQLIMENAASVNVGHVVEHIPVAIAA